jgi:hypothetical protein
MNAVRTNLGKPRDPFLITTTPSICPRHHSSMWSISDRLMFSSGPTLSIFTEKSGLCVEKVRAVERVSISNL